MSISTARSAAHVAATTHTKQYLHVVGALEVVVVAGLPESGKAIFLSRLREGDIPSGLDLPDGALRWPVVRTSRNPLWPRGASGVILDYDMSGRALSDGAAFGGDPALDFLARARSVTVVNMRPPLYQLISQVSQRAVAEAMAKENEQRRLFWRLALPAFLKAEPFLPFRLAAALRRSSPLRHEKKLGSCARKLNLYKRDWLDGLYGRWADYLDELERSGTPVRQVFVEPAKEPFRWVCIDADRSSRQSGIVGASPDS